MTHVFRNQTQNTMAEASAFAQLQHGKRADDESGVVVSKFSLTLTNILEPPAQENKQWGR